MTSQRQPAGGEFRFLIDHAPLGYQSLDEFGRLLRVNAAWLAMLGYEEHEVLGRPIADFVAPEEHAVLAERFAQFKKTGEIANLEFHIRRADGTVCEVRVDGAVRFDDQGEFLHTNCLLRDMSAEREAMMALVSSERKYRRLVELAQEGIWETDAEGYTTFVNPAMALMLGYREDEMLGRHLGDFLAESSRDAVRAVLERRAEKREGLHDLELLAKDGSAVTATLATAPIHDDGGGYRGTLAGVIDVTDRRDFEQRMLHAQKLECLGVLAGGIAHDFNNLLQAIMGNVDLARLDLADGDPAGHCLDEIENASRRATELCRQMLAYAGRGSLVVGAVDLGALLTEMTQILRASISKKVDLRIDLREGLPAVHGDATQLRQVVMNLITNASESFAGAPGTIHVELSAPRLEATALADHHATSDLEPGRYLRLRVEDNGCGMSRDVRERIFDPFFTTKVAGRGLGLAAAMGIARAHRGAVVVESEPNRGTMLDLLLPALEAAAAPVAPPAAAPPVRESAKTVLLADDEASVRQVAGRMLERLGYRVVEAADGEEAVALFQKHRADLHLVILDLTMPVLDGREALERMRDLDPSVAVVICSGYTKESVSGGFETLAPDGFLEKPYQMGSLREILLKVASDQSKTSGSS